MMIRAILRLVFSRLVLFVLSFVAAIGVPFLTFDSTWRASAWNKVKSVASRWSGDKIWTGDATWTGDAAWTGDTTSSVSLAPDARAGQAASSGGPSAPPTLTGTPIQGLHELFAWEITPQDVMNRWATVSTAVDEPSLDGLRAPVLTGPSPDDLAGVITYYFNHQGQLKRIAFDGQVGDPSQLVAYVTRRFSLQKQHFPGLDLYLTKWNGVPTSVMRMRRATVVDVSRPHLTTAVMLELNLPSMNYRLSRRAYTTLLQDGVIRR